MPLVWTDDLDTGIKVIDTQHRQLARYINALESVRVKGDRAATGKVLGALHEYTVSHFGFEESLQEEAGYPFLKAHKRVHELFAQRVEGYVEQFKHGEDVGAEVHDLLCNWLISHIRHDDNDYVGHVRKYLDAQARAKIEDEKSGWMARALKKFF